MLGWLKRLFSNPPKAPPIQMDDLYIAPSSHSAGRAEAAMPGTGDLPPLLVLDPPPLPPDFVPYDPDGPPRDHGPNPVAEFSIAIPAAQPFDTKALHGHLRAEMGKDDFMCYVKTEAGQITYMISGDGPTKGTVLIPAWSFYPGANNTPDTIPQSAERLRNALAKWPTAFDMPQIDPAAVEAAFDTAQKILAIAPDSVTIWAAHTDDRPMDGRAVWTTLHRLGFQWGDMDCFQWADPTNQTDYLIWVEVRDGKYDYALPEEIAAGQQHFHAVSFTVTLPRTPAAVHVTQQMIRAATEFARELQCDLGATIDNQGVDGPDALVDAAQNVTNQLATLGTRPGESAVCMLR